VGLPGSDEKSEPFCWRKKNEDGTALRPKKNQAKLFVLGPNKDLFAGVKKTNKTTRIGAGENRGRSGYSFHWRGVTSVEEIVSFRKRTAEYSHRPHASRPPQKRRTEETIIRGGEWGMKAGGLERTQNKNK